MLRNNRKNYNMIITNKEKDSKIILSTMVNDRNSNSNNRLMSCNNNSRVSGNSNRSISGNISNNNIGNSLRILERHIPLKIHLKILDYQETLIIMIKSHNSNNSIMIITK